MNVGVMTFYFHCCSIIVGILPFILYVQLNGMCVNPGLIDRTASDMPRVHQGVGAVNPWCHACNGVLLVHITSVANA